MRNFLLLFTIFAFIFHAFPFSCAEDACPENCFIDISDILEKTSYTDIPEEMKVFFCKVDAVYKSDPDAALSYFFDEREKLTINGINYIFAPNELYYIFYETSMKYGWDFMESFSPTLLPSEHELHEADAIRLAWDAIMQAYGETEEGINDFDICSSLSQSIIRGILRPIWDIDFYYKEIDIYWR